MTERKPAPQFDSAQQQLAASVLGMWIFLATEVLFFGCLFAAYAVVRWTHPDGFAAAAGRTDLLLGTVESIVLVTSSLTVALALRSHLLGRRRWAVGLLLTTSGLGLIFLGLHGVEYAQEYEAGLMPGLRFTVQGPHSRGIALFYCLYYVMTGMHGLHVAIGVLLLGVMAAMAARGRFSRAYRTPLLLAGLYWSFVDVVWLFLYPVIYLGERA